MIDDAINHFVELLDVGKMRLSSERFSLAPRAVFLRAQRRWQRTILRNVLCAVLLETSFNINGCLSRRKIRIVCCTETQFRCQQFAARSQQEIKAAAG